jgi:ABC-type amino acid transport system permease subunit
MARGEYIKFGFQSTMGSLSAMALLGLVAVVGIFMVAKSRDPETGETNTPLMVSGFALIVSTALPMLPYIGLGMAFDQLSE